MRWIVGAVAVTALLAGCGGGDGDPAVQGRGAPGSGAADCTTQVRYQGTVYSHLDYGSADVTRVGMADESSCSDVGPSAQGPYFPSNPHQVEVLAFEGVPISEAVGVRHGELLGLFVSDDVTPARTKQIVDKLGQP